MLATTEMGDGAERDGVMVRLVFRQEPGGSLQTVLDGSLG